jgi:predicted peroxiredoxin
MAKVLIHIHTGPSDPTKATLGCLVAATALREGHEVNVFMAGDATHLLAPATIAGLEGLGTGRLADHLAAIRDRGGHMYISGMSAKARGYDATLLEGWPAEFAMPEVLVKLATTSDTCLCY